MPFDLSVPKIMVFLVVALMVLGPERLPVMLRKAGRYLGDLKRFRESVQSEVKGVLDEIPDLSSTRGSLANPLSGGESPFAGLHESVSSIGQSLRSALGTGMASGPADDKSGGSHPRRPLPPPGHSNRTPGGKSPDAAPASGASGASGASDRPEDEGREKAGSSPGERGDAPRSFPSSTPAKPPNISPFHGEPGLN